MGFEVECTTCKKKFQLASEWHYKYRLKRNNGRGVFCSNKCGQSGKIQSIEHRRHISEGLNRAVSVGCKSVTPIISVSCSKCGRQIQMKEYAYRQRVNKNKRHEIFCSESCAGKDRSPSQETRDKIGNAQRGISVLSRGRPGYVPTEERKKRISESKKGKPCIVDWDVVRKELGPNAIITQKYMPDGTEFVDGKKVAIEVEKERHETGIRRKMKDIEKNAMNAGYDKVKLIWYLPDGTRVKEWIFENGTWTSS